MNPIWAFPFRPALPKNVGGDFRPIRSSCAMQVPFLGLWSTHTRTSSIWWHHAMKDPKFTSNVLPKYFILFWGNFFCQLNLIKFDKTQFKFPFSYVYVFLIVVLVVLLRFICLQTSAPVSLKGAIFGKKFLFLLNLLVFSNQLTNVFTRSFVEGIIKCGKKSTFVDLFLFCSTFHECFFKFFSFLSLFSLSLSLAIHKRQRLRKRDSFVADVSCLSHLHWTVEWQQQISPFFRP